MDPRARNLRVAGVAYAVTPAHTVERYALSTLRLPNLPSMEFMSNVIRRTGFVTLVLLSLGVAGYAVAVYGFLPLGSLLHPEMRATFTVYPVGIYAHVFGSVIALALGPCQFSSQLRARRLQLHRWLGRLYLGVGVLVGGVSGLFMAFHAFGGLPARLGFACLALAWLYSGYRAYRAIRSRDVMSHRRWMVRNFALTFAAVTLRLYLPTSIASGVAFEAAYPVIAWLCWVPNLVAAELLFNKKHHPSIAGASSGLRSPSTPDVKH